MQTKQFVKRPDRAGVLSFRDFLTDNGALAGYDNENNNRCIPKGVEPKYWINFAFLFKASADGEAYWKALNTKWLDLLRDSQLKIVYEV